MSATPGSRIGETPLRPESFFFLSRESSLTSVPDQVTCLGGPRPGYGRNVWTYAEAHDFVIVTKDADFSDLGLARGFPPKVIWLRLGNCTTRHIEQALRDNWTVVAALDEDPNLGIVDVT